MAEIETLSAKASGMTRTEIKDSFSLFYLRYMKNNHTKDEYFWTKHPYHIDKTGAETLQRKKGLFATETKVRSALHITMVTTFGLAEKGYRSIAQSEIVMDDLFL